MRISIEVNLNYRFAQSNTVFLAIEAAQALGQTIQSSQLILSDAQITRIAGDSGVGQRIWAQVPDQDMQLTYTAEVEITRQARSLEGLCAAPLHQIPAEVAPYLRPSRYCQSDKFSAFIAKQFGHLDGGHKVQAIRDWIASELSYVPGASDANTTVLDTFASRQGVCRDYAHLLCTMVRAASIPARAVSVYGPDVVPQDFHAVAEVWLDGAWHLVDATGMGTPESLCVIAVGRDAYDIAFMDSASPAEMLNQQVCVRRI